MDLEQELKVAEDLALKAGSIALKMQTSLSIRQKPLGEGPVTNADLAIDEFIVESLKATFPNDQIISEESFSPDRNFLTKERTWFVDPIDGTSNYMVGGSDFVIMIGLAIDGKARLGVIFQPTKNRLWRGVITKEKTLAEKIESGKLLPLVIAPKPRPLEDLKVLASRTHRSLKEQALFALLKPKNIRYQSSLGLKAMSIVDEKADLYVVWSKHIKKWDTCAPAAIITAALAHISLINGESLNYLSPIIHDLPLMVYNFTPDERLLTILKMVAENK